jgi:hypothetical protein
MLYALLNVLNCDIETALGQDRALAMMARADFDAVLLDLRRADVSAKPLLSRISQINPSLGNRVLVITGEVGETNLAGQYGPRLLPRAADIRMMENIHQRLQALWMNSTPGDFQEPIDRSSSAAIDKFRKEMAALIDEVVARLNHSVRTFHGATSEELRTELQKKSGKLLAVAPGPLRKQTEAALQLITDQLKGKEVPVASEAADIFRAKIAEIFAILQPHPNKFLRQELQERK